MKLKEDKNLRKRDNEREQMAINKNEKTGQRTKNGQKGHKQG